MNKNEQNINYHEALEHISSEMDPILKQLQELNRGDESKDSVLGGLISAPFRDMKQLSKTFNDLSNFNISFIPIFGALFTGILTPFTDKPLWFNILMGLLVFVILYFSLIPYYFKRLTTFGDKMFHLNVYKKYRRQEYNLLSYAVESNLSYKALYDFVTGVLTHQDNTSKTIEIVTEQYNKEKDEIRKAHKEQLREFYGQVAELNKLINELQEESNTYDKALIYLDELLTDINVILFRIVNGLFGVSDLKFLAGFTIYKQEDNKIHKIYDEGTTGSTPDVIDLNDENFQNWPLVIVAKQKLFKPKISQPRDKYNVISYRMPLGKPPNDVWIFNFHINRETNEKAWYLLRDNDTIAKEEIFRLFHALSLMLYNQLGGVVSGDSRKNKSS